MSEYDLPRLLSQIERNLDWGAAANWQSRDFERLNILIFEKTKISLSASTLRRIWGRVNYTFKPSMTTLDALAQFAGHANWRAYCQKEAARNEHPEAVSVYRSPASKFKVAAFLTSTLVLAVFLVLYFTTSKFHKALQSAPAGLSYSFSSRPVTRDIPNSVVFTYDARSAGTASVAIQQSWDATKRSTVPGDKQKFTSIYYRPGFYQAKLVVSGVVVKQHPLLIPTHGWLGLIANEPVPVYLSSTDILHRDSLGISADVLTRHVNTAQSSASPASEFYNVGNFVPVPVTDFSFSVELKNTYQEGTAKCQLTNILLITDNQPISIPLSIPGCISNIRLSNGQDDISGKSADLSAFGTDLSGWTKVACRGSADSIAYLVNDRLVFKSKRPDKPLRILGLGFTFQGAGMIKKIRLISAKKVVFSAF
jgi:hypothetical protein